MCYGLRPKLSCKHGYSIPNADENSTRNRADSYRTPKSLTSNNHQKSNIDVIPREQPVNYGHFHKTNVLCPCVEAINTLFSNLVKVHVNLPIIYKIRINTRKLHELFKAIAIDFSQK